MRKSTMPVRTDLPDDHPVEGHRPPTPGEIKFGEGATHYRTFELREWLKPDRTKKCWIKADDGHRYYR